MTVTLHVDASTANVITNANVDTYCNFGQASGTNENFTINVNAGDTITWVGVANPASVIVTVTQIVYEGNQNVLGGNGTINGNVGHVLPTAGGENEIYKIFFTVSNQRGVLHIDPRINVLS